MKTDMIRRNSRFLAKWLAITGFTAVAFKLSYDSLVQYFRDTSGSSIIPNDSSQSFINYEQSLLSWVKTGRTLDTNKKSQKQFKRRNDLKLIGAQIFFRHGARTPIRLLPNLEEVIYTKTHIHTYPPSKWDIKLIRKIGNDIVDDSKVLSATDVGADGMKRLKSVDDVHVTNGQLTAIGEKQLHQLGQRIRKELIDDENEGLIPRIYDPNYIYCRSTFMNRTVASARSFLAGFFSTDEGEKKILANKPFEIEVRHFRHEDMFPNVHLYPILRTCLSSSSLYQSLNDDHDMKRARNAFIQQLRTAEQVGGIPELHDDIVSRLAHNFPVDKDLLELTKDFEVMSAREFIYRGTSIGFDQFIRSSCGALLYRIRENFQSILDNYLQEKNQNVKKPYQKFFVYSGHDSTIVPLAMALEIFDMRWPRFASYILMKYFISQNNPKETFVTVTFSGEPQILPNCDDFYCPYEIFLNNLRDRFEKPLSPTSD